MIKSFKCRETEKIFNLAYSRKLPQDIQEIALRKLWMIDASTNINDFKIPPSNHLEKLQGKIKNYYSIRINKQWRICFIWQKNDAFDIKIIDYH
ncbi:type II toxin-antitoxin system RelE/ParE family toxin [Candidatus Parcubacteria bacterium]|nr:type II toxin-antitoxin system RelE/ParE family toxin [Candidatus Parcubacteria bacterium]